MSMDGLLSGYNVVRAYALRATNTNIPSINPPSWDLGIIVFATGNGLALAFPSMFAPNVSNWAVAAYATDNSGYDSFIVFDNVSASSITLVKSVTVEFILFSARK